MSSDDPARPRDVAYPKSGAMEPTVAPCRNLRTKTMFYAFNREHALELGPECDARAYWCVLTGTPLGPDGDPAGEDSCQPGRGCCEP